MFTIIGAMAELESSLISERVTAGMRAAETRGKHLGRPVTQQRIIREIETIATSTDLSIRQIQSKIAGRASRGIVGKITKHARATQPTGREKAGDGVTVMEPPLASGMLPFAQSPFLRQDPPRPAQSTKGRADVFISAAAITRRRSR